MNLHSVDPKAICRESWWIGVDRSEFTKKRLEREEDLRPAFGSQPVGLIPSKAESSFMDQKGRNQ